MFNLRTNVETFDDVRREFQKINSFPSVDLLATVVPTASDDVTKGFAPGSVKIVNNNEEYVCLSAAQGNAKWKLRAKDFSGGVAGGGAEETTAIFQAGQIGYAPFDATKWDSGDPGLVDDALDQLAERIKDVEGGVGVGDVDGPASATDNAAARFNGTTGKLIQNSGLIVSDAVDLSGIGNIALSGTVDGRDVSVDGAKLDTVESFAVAMAVALG